MRKTATKSTKRKPGRPRDLERPLPPERLEELENKWLKGWSHRRLAARFGVTEGAIRHHLRHTVVPAFQETLWHTKQVKLRQLRLITRRAWQEFHSTADSEVIETIKEVLSQKGRKVKLRTLRRKLPERKSAWLTVILDCIREECRILGHYAKDKREVELKTSGELRYAGRSVSDVDREMLAKLVAAIEERREYERQVAEYQRNGEMN
jgi:hypothetical protein